MKILFLWDWEPEYSQATMWEDGLAAALKELIDRGHEVKLFTASSEPTIIKHPYFDIHVSEDMKREALEYAPDTILYWGDMTRPNAPILAETGIPMAICFAGGEPISYNTDLFSHIFVESQVYEDIYKNKGYSVSRAFGTNTTLFKPVEQNKVFDTIFPATFAAWKRHELYAYSTAGLVSLAAGYMYEDHETECWQKCIDMGVVVLPSTPQKVLHRLYAASRLCAVPSQSNGGSQRTVLEAMAMNMPTVVTDSDKFDFAEGKVFVAEPTVQSFGSMIRMALDSEVNTRDYIVEYWSEFSYADSLERGLEKICA